MICQNDSFELFEYQYRCLDNCITFIKKTYKTKFMFPFWKENSEIQVWVVYSDFNIKKKKIHSNTAKQSELLESQYKINEGLICSFGLPI